MPLSELKCKLRKREPRDYVVELLGARLYLGHLEIAGLVEKPPWLPCGVVVIQRELLLGEGESSPRLWRWLALRDSGIGQAASLPERRRRRLLGQASVKRGCGDASF